MLPSTEAGIIPEQATVFNFPLDFEAGTILAFLFCYIALIVNELGSIQAVGHMLQADRMDQRTTRGVGIVGVTNVLSGLFGVIGPVDYSMSPGVISATGCASRYTLLPAGAGLILCAFFPSVVGMAGDDSGRGDGCDFALLDGDAIGRRVTDVGEGEGDRRFR